MHKHPNHPGKKSLELKFAEICHGLISTYSCERAFIVIFKRLRRLAFDHMHDVFAYVPAHLDSDLGNTRMAFWRFACNHRGYVAYCKDVRVPRYPADTI